MRPIHVVLSCRPGQNTEVHNLGSFIIQYIPVDLISIEQHLSDIQRADITVLTETPTCKLFTMPESDSEKAALLERHGFRPLPRLPAKGETSVEFPGDFARLCPRIATVHAELCPEGISRRSYVQAAEAYMLNALHEVRANVVADLFQSWGSHYPRHVFIFQELGTQEDQAGRELCWLRSLLSGWRRTAATADGDPAVVADTDAWQRSPEDQCMKRVAEQLPLRGEAMFYVVAQSPYVQALGEGAKHYCVPGPPTYCMAGIRSHAADLHVLWLNVSPEEYAQGQVEQSCFDAINMHIPSIDVTTTVETIPDDHSDELMPGGATVDTEVKVEELHAKKMVFLKRRVALGPQTQRALLLSIELATGQNIICKFGPVAVIVFLTFVVAARTGRSERTQWVDVKDPQIGKRKLHEWLPRMWSANDALPRVKGHVQKPLRDALKGDGEWNPGQVRGSLTLIERVPDTDSSI